MESCGVSAGSTGHRADGTRVSPGVGTASELLGTVDSGAPSRMWGTASAPAPGSRMVPSEGSLSSDLGQVGEGVPQA